jgi:cytochrome c-type biogenesis protein CcmF
VTRDGHYVADIYPGRTVYASFPDQPTSNISITTYNLRDLYVFLADWNGTQTVTLQVFLNPLVELVWLGGVLMLAGGIFCWWPERRRAAALLEARPERVEVAV